MKTIRTSQKGMRFTSDYLPYDKVSLKGNELLWDGKPIIGFYILFSINTGLRCSDVLCRKHYELASLLPGSYLTVTEKKTRKTKEIQINSKIITAYKDLINRIGPVDPSDYIFRSQKGSVYHTESINCLLKSIFAGYAPHISSHSLRKTFGRAIYEANGRSEDCLIKLSELFQHTSMAVTRRYLGIRREELSSLYMNL